MITTCIPYSYIRDRTRLTWREVEFGLNRRLISPEVAIKKASEEVASKGSPVELLNLSCRKANDPIIDLVSQLAACEDLQSPEEMKAKWLYLILSWLFENRLSIDDPLKTVEEIYSDFDYPSEVASFVRYMPMEGPDLGNIEQNEARLFANWKAYLDGERRRFAP